MKPTKPLATAILRLALCYRYRHGLLSLVDDDVRTWPRTVLSQPGDDWNTREMERQFEGIIDKVSEELYKISSSSLEFVRLESYLDALSAPVAEIDALTRDVSSISRIDDQLPSQVYRLLLPSIEEGWHRARIDEPTRACGRSAVMLCCQMLLTWARIFPSANKPAGWNTLLNSFQLVKDTHTAVVESRRMDSGTGTTPYVVRMQRVDISTALRDIELFGLPVEKRFSRVPITISYLTGRMQSTGDAQSTRGIPLNRLLVSIAQQASEENLGRGMRLVIAGRAGSGKSTAVQWLAFTTAQGRLHGLVPENQPVLPLFVRLREVVTSAALTDRSLLYMQQLQDEVSAEWLQECGSSLTPLILLDGWDEIASHRRKAAEEWVMSLSARFPAAHMVITSRPEGLTDDLFRRMHFEQVNVLPLRADESSELARRWFRGLTDVLHAGSGININDVELAQKELIRDLTTPAISDMADSPLLTAMLCCLYATGNTSAPEKRGNLYDLVVTALLDARERERGECPPEWKALDVRKKKLLVGGVAKAMAEHNLMTLPVNGTSMSSTPTVRGIVAHALRMFGKEPMEASAWTEIVLARSIVLQRISTEEVEFAHRSIQDYLAAKAFLDARSVGRMCELAEAGQWSILPFACYEAEGDLDTVDQIVEWLLTRTEIFKGAEKRLVLSVLVECLGAVTTMSPDLRARAEQAAETIFPPRDEVEMKSLASLGDAAVSYLAEDRVVGASTRRLAIEALSRIGTTGALDALSQYARVGAPADIAALAEAFARFDPEVYTKRVLAEIRTDLSITLHDATRVAHLCRLPNVTLLAVHGVRGEGASLSAAQKLPRLDRLELKDCGDVESLAWTSQVRSLRSLSLVNCKALHQVHELGPDALWALHVEKTEFERVDWIDVLKDKKQLRVLSLVDVDSNSKNRAPGVNIDVLPLSHLSVLNSLNTLTVDGGLRCDSLNFLQHHTRLRKLRTSHLLSEEDVWSISRCTSLRTLKIRIATTLTNISILTRLAKLESLTVTDISRTQTQEIVGMPGLRDLSVHDSNLGAGFLFVPESVTSLKLSNCTFSGAYRVAENKGLVPPKLTNLESVVWNGGQLRDLDFLLGMPALRLLEVQDNGSIESLEDLDRVPSGCVVRLSGTRLGVDEAPIRRLQNRCTVIYEPGYDLDGHDSNHWVDLGGS